MIFGLSFFSTKWVSHKFDRTHLWKRWLVGEGEGARCLYDLYDQSKRPNEFGVKRAGGMATCHPVPFDSLQEN
jgi:hypothetical protein